jgi:isocitrate/isopropylmalate dehydrogenase
MLKRPSAEMLLACETILLGFEARKEMKTYRIATIPGDGIGKEVVPEGVRVLEAAARKHGFAFKWTQLPWSCEFYDGTEDEVVTQQTVFTRRGVDRILGFAFDSARSRSKKHLTSATKSNGITVTMPFWDDRVKEAKRGQPR